MTVNSVKSDINVYVNGVVLTGLVKAEVSDVNDYKEAYEFLSDEAYAVCSNRKGYLITLCFYGKKPMPFGEYFTLTVENNNILTVYNNCNIKSLINSYTNGRESYEIKIFSTEKE